jgi:elongation factor 1-alpha
MKFRLEEGLGEAFYNLGYEDDGNPLGLSDEELEQSLSKSEKILELIGKKLSATCHSSSEQSS